MGELLGQTKHAKRDWIITRLRPKICHGLDHDASHADVEENLRRGQTKQVTLVLNNTSRGSRVKQQDVQYKPLPERHRVKRIRVERTSRNCKGRPQSTAHNFEVPEAEAIVPRKRPASGNSFSKEDVAWVPRTTPPSLRPRGPPSRVRAKRTCRHAGGTIGAHLDSTSYVCRHCPPALHGEQYDT